MLATYRKSRKRKDLSMTQHEPQENAAVLGLAKDLEPGDGGDKTKATGVTNSCNVRFGMVSLPSLQGEGGDETKATGEKKSSTVLLVRTMALPLEAMPLVQSPPQWCTGQ